MYKVIIELNRNITDEELKTLTEIITNAFDNCDGKVQKSQATSPYEFLFEGDEDKFGCLQIGLLNLSDVKLFWDNADVWKWIDEEDESENCNVKDEFADFVKW